MVGKVKNLGEICRMGKFFNAGWDARLGLCNEEDGMRGWVYVRSCTVNLCLVTIKHKNPSCTNITVPQKYVFDFKE